MNNRTKNYFSKEDTQITTDTKKQSTSLVIGKISVNQNITLLRLAIIKKKSKQNKYWQEGREQGMLAHYWWECKLIQLLWKRAHFLKKSKMDGIANVSFRNLIVGYISKENEIYLSMRHWHFHIYLVYS